MHFIFSCIAPNAADLEKTACCCIETWIIIVLGRNPRARLEVIRASILTLACVGILFADYRLLAAGLLTAIPAVLLTGLARALEAVATNHIPLTRSTYRHMDLLYCYAGVVITFACTALRGDESWPGFYYAVQLKHVPLLGVNILATAAAMLLGQSFLFPMNATRRDSHGFGEDNTASNTLTLLAMTGVIGLTWSLMLRRSYASLPQLFFFFCAAIVVRMGERFDVSSLHNWLGRYAALPRDFAIVSMDSEETAVSETESDATRVSDSDGRRRNHLLRIFLVAIILPTLWIPFMVLNFSERLFQKTINAYPILDREYTPQAPIELVISMYKEPVDEVATLVSRLKAMPNLRDLRIHIYIKDNETNTDRVKMGTGADKITVLPNIGREGQTYLYHILNNWDTLAKHTAFLQANVHNPREFYPRIRDYFDPAQTGMLSLGWSGQVCNCEECGDRFSFWDTTHLFPRIYNRINNSTQCDKVLMSYKGQFITSAKRIRGVDISVYRDLHEAFVDEGSWAHQEEYFQGREDSMSAPIFGYTMERMWNLLFQCNSMDVAWKCPTLLSGNRIGGGIEDCQCFDPVS